MTPDDQWESRLRDTLRRGDQPPVDVEGFLGDVHRGARGRRRRQYVGVAATVALLTGGGYALGSAVNLGDDKEADIAERTVSSTGASTGTPSTTATTDKTDATVTNAPEATRVLSLTSTGNEHQWALVKSDGCGRDSCAVVFAKTADNDAWTSLGELSVSPSPESGDIDAVTNLRFAGDAEDGYNAWAFGPGLVTSHSNADGLEPASTWTAAELPVEGQVTYVEARAGVAYLLIVDGEAHASLLSSPTARDDWKAVDVGFELAYADDLVVSQGAVAFIESKGDDGQVVSAPTDSASGEVVNGWAVTQPCGGRKIAHLASASNALWALCADGSVVSASVPIDGEPVWSTVSEGFSPKAQFAAPSSSRAVVAEPTGLTELTFGGDTTLLSDDDFSAASMLGFTNDALGFAVLHGVVYRSTDGGQTWAEDQVVPAPQ